MLERLAFYRDLIVSECLPAVPGVPPGVADYLFAGLTAALEPRCDGVAGARLPRPRRRPQPAHQGGRCSRI